jgi:hypothetical protein
MCDCELCYSELKHVHCFKCGTGFSYEQRPRKSNTIYLFEGMRDVQEGDFIDTWEIKCPCCSAIQLYGARYLDKTYEFRDRYNFRTWLKKKQRRKL